MANSTITFSAKKYLDGEIPFEDMADSAGVSADSLEECTPDQKEAIREEVKEYFWRYLEEATENDNMLVTIQFGDEVVKDPMTEATFAEEQEA